MFKMDIQHSVVKVSLWSDKLFPECCPLSIRRQYLTSQAASLSYHNTLLLDWMAFSLKLGPTVAVDRGKRENNFASLDHKERCIN